MSLPPRGQIRAEEGVRYNNIIRLCDIFVIRKGVKCPTCHFVIEKAPMSMHPTAVSEQNCLYFHGILLDKHDSAKPNLLASNSMILFLHRMIVFSQPLGKQFYNSFFTQNDCTFPSLLANTFSIFSCRACDRVDTQLILSVAKPPQKLNPQTSPVQTKASKDALLFIACKTPRFCQKKTQLLPSPATREFSAAPKLSNAPFS